ncbi:MAG: hypothetical protein IPM64_17685 [Phycisphaerales bacterium]|nr:hypothetical protein [Phycisphaerales bacterium]
MDYNIPLGSKVRDIVTGFEGVATARVQYLNGCVQFCILPASIDGKMPEGAYVDYQRLEVINRTQAQASVSDAGGPMRDTPAASYEG